MHFGGIVAYSYHKSIYELIIILNKITLRVNSFTEAFDLSDAIITTYRYSDEPRLEIILLCLCPTASLVYINQVSSVWHVLDAIAGRFYAGELSSRYLPSYLATLQESESK